MGAERLIDLSGQRFGMLLVLHRAGSYQYKSGSAPTWQVRCDCGRTKIVAGPNLRNGSTRSCGCVQRPHGMFGTPEYGAWVGMIQRCTNPKGRAFPNYGGRGITVCPRWLNSFQNFFADMGPRPSRGLSLDRIDNNGPYAPENCRWATRKQQARNKRTSRVLVVDGVSATIPEWVERTGLLKSTIRERLRRGWTPKRAVSTPVPSTTAVRAAGHPAATA